MTTADGWVTCDLGHRHWGRAGAAGLLIRHGEPGQLVRFLLQHRSPSVHHGDTWGIPGGALGWTEPPLAGACREADEEMGELPEGLTVVLTSADEHGGWTYHTVPMDAPTLFEPGPGGRETGGHGHGWFTREETRALSLHPGFAASFASTTSWG